MLAYREQQRLLVMAVRKSIVLVLPKVLPTECWGKISCAERMYDE